MHHVSAQGVDERMINVHVTSMSKPPTSPGPFTPSDETPLAPAPS